MFQQISCSGSLEADAKSEIAPWMGDDGPVDRVRGQLAKILILVLRIPVMKQGQL